MKRICWSLIICLSFLLSSCSLGLVAVHDEPPFICFKRKCREMAKLEGKSNGKRMTFPARGGKLNSKRVKKRKSKSSKSSKKKKGSPRFI
ncbi:hypothetical protein BH10BAC1_BH10BAC1_01880 [soil metagenome]